MRENVPAVVNRDCPAVAAKSAIARDRTDPAGIAAIAAPTGLAQRKYAVRRHALGRNDSAIPDRDTSAIAASASIAGDRACTAGPAPSSTAPTAAFRRDSMRIVSSRGDDTSVGDIHTAAAATIFSVTSYPARTTGATAIAAGAAKTLTPDANRAAAAGDDAAAAVYRHQTAATASSAVPANATHPTGSPTVARSACAARSEDAIRSQQSTRRDVACREYVHGATRPATARRSTDAAGATRCSAAAAAATQTFSHDAISAGETLCLNGRVIGDGHISATTAGSTIASDAAGASGSRAVAGVSTATEGQHAIGIKSFRGNRSIIVENDVAATTAIAAIAPDAARARAGTAAMTTGATETLGK